MKDPTSKAELLEMIVQERHALDTLLEDLSPTQMIEPVLEGGWSIKDLLAHIEAWETTMVQWLRSILGDGDTANAPYGLSDADVDEVNRGFYEQNRDKTLEQVRDEYVRSYKEALKTVQDFPEEIMFGDKFSIWGEELPAWMVIGANTCGHYVEHREQLMNR